MRGKRRFFARLARLALLALPAGAALVIPLVVPRAAHAFCRTTTSPLPADFQPSVDACWTQGLPLWWRNACVGYSIQKTASRQVAYDDAATHISNAFTKWTG